MQKGSGFQVEQLWALIFIALIFSIVITRALEAIQDRTTAWSSSHGAP
jgi:ABC-type nitrate/sulfonate/bicarbonate transport system permease component